MFKGYSLSDESFDKEEFIRAYIEFCDKSKYSKSDLDCIMQELSKMLHESSKRCLEQEKEITTSKQDYNQALEDVEKILEEIAGNQLHFSPWGFSYSVAELWGEGYNAAVSTIRKRLNALREKNNVKE